MKRLAALGLTSLIAVSTGCVPVERYNALRLEARQNEEARNSAESKERAAREKADTLQRQLDALMASGGDTASHARLLQEQLATKQTELDELNRRYAEAIAKAGAAGSMLPAPLTNELSKLAAANPDTIEFDEATGIIKFKSDVTFDTGDATIKPKAKEVLTKFASIVNSPAAANYELLVAGHTDATPVNNPETIRKGHKNNWYLSSHRAISVGEVLAAEKVNPQRIGVVGYADQRPVASNGSEAGKAANRRVEVLILPRQVRSSAPAAAPGAPAAPKPAGNNKDGAAAPSAPAPAPIPADNK
jgi:chemotaxis protein MotB